MCGLPPRLGSLAVPTLARSFTGVFSKARVEGSSGYSSHWVLGMLCLFLWAEGKEKLGLLVGNLLDSRVTGQQLSSGSSCCPQIALDVCWEALSGSQPGRKVDPGHTWGRLPVTLASSLTPGNFLLLCDLGHSACLLGSGGSCSEQRGTATALAIRVLPLR